MVRAVIGAAAYFNKAYMAVTDSIVCDHDKFDGPFREMEISIGVQTGIQIKNVVTTEQAVVPSQASSRPGSAESQQEATQGEGTSQRTGTAAPRQVQRQYPTAATFDASTPVTKKRLDASPFMQIFFEVRFNLGPFDIEIEDKKVAVEDKKWWIQENRNGTVKRTWNYTGLSCSSMGSLNPSNFIGDRRHERMEDLFYM
jgi:flagellar motor switch/type III secretory pathway protein FliN